MSESSGKPSREQLSKTPSWIMLGFVLGCIFALTIKHELESYDETVAAAAAAKPSPPVVPVPARPVAVSRANTITALKDRPSLAAIEDIFINSSSEAKWDSDLTEVALWNPATDKYSDAFEVLRSEGKYYFRTIPALTRPVVDPEQNRLKAILFTGPLPSIPPLLPLNRALPAPPSDR